MKKMTLRNASLHHQAEFITLVSPVAGKASFTFVIISKAADFRFSDLKGSLVVNILVVARTQVIDDANSLSHEVHHVFRIGAADTAVSEDLANALAQNKAGVGNSVFIAQDGANFCRAVTGLCKVQNDGLDGILVGVGPRRGLCNMRP